MPESNAVWRVDWGTLTFCADIYSKYQYTISGDTAIGINTYKKIYKSGMENMCGTVGNYFYNYAGGMRQDTINKKVYFICPSNLTDTLLYDFSLNVGDTIHSIFSVFGCPQSYSPNPIISTIDSVLVGNNFHKRFNTYSGFSFIEGIGNITGFLEPIDLWENESWQLVCFNHNTDIYPSNSNSCSLVTGSFNEQKEKNTYQIQIYPNPIEDISILEFNANINKTMKVFIYNALGNLVKTISNVRSNKLNLCKKDFNTGLYFIRLTDESKSSVAIKFIVN